MLLSKTDIKRIKKTGYKTKDFVLIDTSGFAKLRNTRGHCFFYQPNGRRCSVYDVRPTGCRIYPIIYSMEEGVIVDDFCPRWKTVPKCEIDSQKSKLLKFLRKVDTQAISRG
jgi:Fe-S-cluster containining protein